MSICKHDSLFPTNTETICRSANAFCLELEIEIWVQNCGIIPTRCIMQWKTRNAIFIWSHLIESVCRVHPWPYLKPDFQERKQLKWTTAPIWASHQQLFFFPFYLLMHQNLDEIMQVRLFSDLKSFSDIRISIHSLGFSVIKVKTWISLCYFNSCSLSYFSSD